MSNEIKQVFTTPDGQTFDTRQEAADHIRIPQVRAALMPLTKGNEELVQWLIDNQDEVSSAFETGTIRRVSKKEKKQIKTEMDLIVKSDLDIPFFKENAEQFVESFRWPAVKRLKDEEKAAASQKVLMELTEDNNDLTTWILDNKDGLLEAYEAGRIKRQVSDKAKEALEAYRAKKAAEKAAAEATAE